MLHTTTHKQYEKIHKQTNLRTVKWDRQTNGQTECNARKNITATSLDQANQDDYCIHATAGMAVLRGGAHFMAREAATLAAAASTLSPLT